MMGPACGSIPFVVAIGSRPTVLLIATLIENVMIGTSGIVKSVTAALMGSPNFAAAVEGYPSRTMTE